MSTKQRLTDEQEQMRLDGLRRLARIIARHALAQSTRSADPSSAERQAPAHNAREVPDRAPERKDGAA